MAIREPSQVTSDRLTPVDGLIRVPSVAPQPDRLDRVPADPEVTRYWLDRLHRVAALVG